jgi:hypothetical protein
MNAPDDLDQLLERWEELCQQGQQPTPEELCKETPQLLAELRKRITALCHIDSLLVDGSAATIFGEAPGGPLPVVEIALTLPGYVLLEKIGHGGMGVVYKAWDVALKRFVAVKLLLPRFLSDDKRRFRAEAQSQAQLVHPNILTIHQVGEHEGQMFLTLEYAEQGSISDVLKQTGPVPAKLAAGWIRQVAEGLQAAHERKVIHRDIKPGNILRGRDGNLKLADFGLAKWLDQDDSLTPTVAIVGTPGYMPPELAAGKAKEAGPAADIYSLGATLYALLSGRAPFVGDTKEAVLTKVLSEEPKAPRALRRDIPPALEAVCLKCLHKQPQCRYLSARELAEDLDRFLKGEPTRARPPNWREKTGRWLRRRPWVIAAALLVTFTALAVPMLLFLLDPERPLRNMQKALQQGETVQLIGDDARLRWFRWNGTTGGVAKADPGDGIAFHAQELSLLELFPRPAITEFTFSAEVRHEQGFAGEVGLFWGLQELDTSDGPMLCYYALTFNDLNAAAPNPTAPPGNTLFLRLRTSPKEAHLGTKNMPETGPNVHQFQPSLSGGLGVGPWRHLKVRITDKKITVHWEGKEITTLPVEAFEPRFRSQWLRRWRQSNLENVSFPFRGRLGLFLHEGMATFKNVKLEPG